MRGPSSLPLASLPLGDGLGETLLRAWVGPALVLPRYGLASGSWGHRDRKVARAPYRAWGPKSEGAVEGQQNIQRLSRASGKRKEGLRGFAAQSEPGSGPASCPHPALGSQVPCCPPPLIPSLLLASAFGLPLGPQPPLPLRASSPRGQMAAWEDGDGRMETAHLLPLPGDCRAVTLASPSVLCPHRSPSTSAASSPMRTRWPRSWTRATVGTRSHTWGCWRT